MRPIGLALGGPLGAISIHAPIKDATQDIDHKLDRIAIFQFTHP